MFEFKLNLRHCNVVHASMPDMPGSPEGGRREAGKLRAIVDSFQVG